MLGFDHRAAAHVHGRARARASSNAVECRRCAPRGLRVCWYVCMSICDSGQISSIVSFRFIFIF